MGGNMANLKMEKQCLTVLERSVAAIVGVIILTFSAFLVFSPPIRQTIVNNSGAIQTTLSYSDQSTVVVFLMTVGSILSFYAINGLRLYKFAAGPFSGESENGQGSTSPLKPSREATAELVRANEEHIDLFESLTDNGKKVMRTLWRYQKMYFHDDYKTRWTFKIFANNPEYPAFLGAVSELLGKGLIFINPENEQSALTNEGISLMSSNKVNADNGDCYPF
jgi:hypothetical protein